MQAQRSNTSRIPITEAERTTPAPVRWRAAEPASLLWFDLAEDGGAVVYHRSSGDTHRLDELSSWVVRTLSSGPRCADALAAELADATHSSPGDAARLLAETVAELKRLRLVEDMAG